MLLKQPLLVERATTIIAVLARPLLFLTYWIVGFIPRNSNLWVFGSWSGYRYADNTAAMFEHVNLQPNSRINAVWITRDYRIRDQLRSKGYQSHTSSSLHGIWVCLRAGHYLFDGLTKDINHWLSRGSYRTLLRHGVGIKRIERLVNAPSHRLYKLFHGTLPQRLIWTVLIPWHLVRPNFSIATSPAHARQGAKTFDISEDQISITGFPRNDQLANTSVDATGDPDLIWINTQKNHGHSVILYMPTFRDNQRNFKLDLHELDSMAGRVGIRLLIKLHPVSRRDFVSDSNHLQNIMLADTGLDANRLYPMVDGLISDYSSASFDFILTEKPLIFFVPDQDQYQKFSRSLYYDFNEVTPGPKANTLTELEENLAQLNKDGLESWRDHYSQVLDLFHTYRDGSACERVLAEIKRRYPKH